LSRSLFSLAAVAALALPAFASAETWQFDPPHTSAQFSVRHMGISTVRGAFTKVSGTVQYDPSDVAKSVIDVTIDTTSLDTRVEMRDNHVKSADFLDVAKYPTITFRSRRVEPAGAGHLKVIGDLTIHGTTKQVELDVEGPTPAIKDPRGNEHMGASATTTISRKDFGVSNMEGMIGDELHITIDAEMMKPAAH